MYKFIFLFLIPVALFSEIKQVGTMKEIAHHFEQLDKKDLAVFDLDDVLVQPDNPASQMANMKKHKEVFIKIIGPLSPEKIDILFVVSTLDSFPILIDPHSLQVLENLSKKQVPTMGLTANFTGKFLHVDCLEDWKIQQIKKLGFDFSTNSPHKGKIVFHNLPQFLNNPVIYKEGILFSNGRTVSKGEALVAFLKTTQYVPQKVLFMDDREENLKKVELALRELNPHIVYTGVHYTAAKDYPASPISEKQFAAYWEKAVADTLKIAVK
jgi:hypothetical protein